MAIQTEYSDFSSKNTDIENLFKNEHNQKNILFSYKNTKNWSSLTHTTHQQPLINKDLPHFFYDLWLTNQKIESPKYINTELHKHYPYIINILLPPPLSIHKHNQKFQKILKIFISTKALNVPFFLGFLRILYFQNLIIFLWKNIKKSTAKKAYTLHKTQLVFKNNTILYNTLPNKKVRQNMSHLQ